MSSQRIILAIGPHEYVLQNHRLHRMDIANRKKVIRLKAGMVARAELAPMEGPVQIIGRLHVQKGVLPDVSAIAPMVKSALDGIVDAGILPGDDSSIVVRESYDPPIRDRSIPAGLHRLEITIQPWRDDA